MTTKNVKIALHVLLFDADDFIDCYMNNCSKYFEKIYAAYSKKPWSYGNSAFINSTSIDAIKAKWGNKITIIEGEWLTEEDQRNACVDAALSDGFDILAIQDADEFYMESDFINIIEHIDANPNIELYKTYWHCFWKNTNYVLSRNGKPVHDSISYAINIKKGIRFTDKRDCNANNSLQIDATCVHLAYVRQDEYMYRKIKTWGHASEFNSEKWYREKWEKWHPRKRNLHPVKPEIWECAIPFKGHIPAALITFQGNNYGLYKPSFYETAKDALCPAYDRLLKFKSKFIRSCSKRITPLLSR